ncbi:DMT family transporter [Salinilacihabitans rarus]|uniref:DMT family transporter n=1 Tax=Salinilacihabitans rarus TaxID=2961596 RepID=UPI0020C8D455|nr:DMT family transporter [Salinilacihabitans rarus]
MNVNRDILLFVALAFAWGTSFAAIEVGLASLPPILFAALRFDVAALLFAGAVVALGSPWRPRTREDWALIAVGAVLVVGAHFALLFLGQSYVSSSVSAIVLSLTPIVTPLLALALLPRQRIRAPAAVGLLAGLLGVVVIAVQGGSLDGRAIGVALLFASAASFALGTVLTERFRGTLPIVSLQAWSMAGGAAVLHALSVAHPGESLAAVDPAPAAFAALAYLAVVATGGGFFAYFVLLEHIGATELSLVNYAVPVVATLVGWAALGESITLATVAGFALILLGFALCKIEALWRLAASVTDAGPSRQPAANDEVAVDGNVYVPDEAAERRGTNANTGTSPGSAD